MAEENWEDLRQRLIGFGEHSSRKSYYPELQRKLTELNESEQLLRLIMESTGDGIYGIDTRGCCTFANSPCIRMLGYTGLADLLGRNMHVLIHHSVADGTPMPAKEC